MGREEAQVLKTVRGSVPRRVHARGATPRAALWLLMKDGAFEPLRLDAEGGEDILAVFSFREEAELFLRFGLDGDGWRVRQSAPGEVVSVLFGPCRAVERVVLDPLPRPLSGGSRVLPTVGRRRFLDRLLAG